MASCRQCDINQQGLMYAEDRVQHIVKIPQQVQQAVSSTWFCSSAQHEPTLFSSCPTVAP
jgi:hypothetical protein